MNGEPLGLDAIEARANAATSGPWAATDDTSDPNDPCQMVVIADDRVRCVAPFLVSRDAEFIAHARTDVPALVAELRAARARIAALEATIAASETVEMLRAALPRDV